VCHLPDSRTTKESDPGCDHDRSCGMPANEVPHAGYLLLLGLDLRAIATPADASLVESFVAKMVDSERSPAMSPSADDDWAAHEGARFQKQLSAFWKGFKEP
jgi:hypothetical protein